MGYTHYFPDLRATAGVIAEAGRIIAASGVTICGPKGQGLPVLSEAAGIRLNGFAAAGEACETFHLRGTEEPGYPGTAESCKTEKRPYDEVVTAILIAAALPELEVRTGVVTSDGRWNEWTAGLCLFERAVRRLTDDERLALELDVERMRRDTFQE